MPPPMCPLEPVPGMVKLIIWAANTKAPPTAIMGSFWRVSWLRCTRAALTASAAALTAHMVSPTVGDNNASDICMGLILLISKIPKASSTAIRPGQQKSHEGRRPALPGPGSRLHGRQCTSKPTGSYTGSRGTLIEWAFLFRSAKALFLRARRPFLGQAPRGRFRALL